MTRLCPLFLLLAPLAVGACGEKDDSAPTDDTDADTDTDTDTDTDADADADTDADADADLDPNTVYADGTASRSADPLSGGTAGVLCLAVVSECPSIKNMGVITAYDGEEIQGVDLTSASQPWTAEFDAAGLVAGTTYAINGYLETDAGACDAEGPSYGELVTFGDTACPTFVWTPGQPVTGAVIDLNFAMPF